jgi:hypothetical protein
VSSSYRNEFVTQLDGAQGESQLNPLRLMLSVPVLNADLTREELLEISKTRPGGAHSVAAPKMSKQEQEAEGRLVSKTMSQLIAAKGASAFIFGADRFAWRRRLLATMLVVPQMFEGIDTRATFSPLLGSSLKGIDLSPDVLIGQRNRFAISMLHTGLSKLPDVRHVKVLYGEAHMLDFEKVRVNNCDLASRPHTRTNYFPSV